MTTTYAQAAASVSGKPIAPAEHHCAANGCPMEGTMASSTNGANEWYCQWHFGQAYGEFGAITARIANRVALIKRARRMCAEPPGAPIERQAVEIKRFYAEAGRADLLRLPKEKPRYLRTLGAHILSQLSREISQPQQRMRESEAEPAAGPTQTKAYLAEALRALGKSDEIEEALA